MKPLSEFSLEGRREIEFVLSDIDDTLTNEGRLPAVAYTAMEKLTDAGFKMIPITGRPAGWCDHIARMWPVDGVVGENGAFYFHYDSKNRKMIRRWWKNDAERAADRKNLDKLKKKILKNVPGADIAADQAYREADLAIDFCEDVPPLPMSEVDRIVDIFHAAGAHAKVSSIHVNGWFGSYDKLTMTKIMFKELFGVDLDSIKEKVVFSGDSPNDSPMFGYFPNAVGVANVAQFSGRLEARPAWITRLPGGHGFAELADALIKAKG